MTSGQHTGSARNVVEKEPPKPSETAHFADLIESIAETKDRDAFKALFAHFAPRLKGYLMRLGASDGQAEEVAQEAMLTVWRKAALFNRKKAAASTWIFTIARNQRIDMLRKMKRTSAEMPVETEDLWQIPGENEDEPVTSLHRLMSERRVRESLSHLPEEQITVIAKVYMESKSHQMVADELNIPLGTVKSRVRLALNKLKVILQDQNV